MWAQLFQELCQHGHDAGDFVEDGDHQGEVDGSGLCPKGRIAPSSTKSPNTCFNQRRNNSICQRLR